jgi:Arc/MetJ-type ribon-helix-helix transcriptional regulator
MLLFPEDGRAIRQEKSRGSVYSKPEETAQVKTLALEVPDRLAEELENLVRAGWFASEEEAVRLALAEFLQRNKLRLQEEHQLEDIRWALELKDAAR